MDAARDGLKKVFPFFLLCTVQKSSISLYHSDKLFFMHIDIILCDILFSTISIDFFNAHIQFKYFTINICIVCFNFFTKYLLKYCGTCGQVIR